MIKLIMNEFNQFISAVVKRRNYPIKLVGMSQSVNSKLKTARDCCATIDSPSDFSTEKVHNTPTQPCRGEVLMNKFNKDSLWVAEAENKDQIVFRASFVQCIASVSHEGKIATERELGQLKLKYMEKDCQERMVAQANYHASEMAVIQQR